MRERWGPDGNGVPRTCVLVLRTVDFIHDHIYLIKSSCDVELERGSESQRDCC